MPGYSNSKRPDVSPEGKPYQAPKAEMGESFNEAMNPPNNPTKDKQPTSYNVNNDYPFYDDKF